MQTFITDFDMAKNAQNLDNKRLGKQRVEAFQILDCLFGIKSGWKNHPAVKMWKGHEAYLYTEYIWAILIEWQNRGFKNTKCWEKWSRYVFLLQKENAFNSPEWITYEFILSHRSNLIRKLPEHYSKLWPDVPNDLPYIWPVN